MDFERATLKKTSVRTLPLWAELEQDSLESPKLQGLPEEAHHQPNGRLSLSAPPRDHIRNSSLSASSSSASIGGLPAPMASSARLSTSTSASASPSPSAPGQAQGQKQDNRNSVSTTRSSQPEWSVFATMSNVSTVSGYKGGLHGISGSHKQDPRPVSPTSPTVPSPTANAMSSLKRFPLKLDEIFKSKNSPLSNSSSNASLSSGAAGQGATCTCNCCNHQGSGRQQGRSKTGLTLSTRRSRKEYSQETRGYPSGYCISSDPPPETNWDEKDSSLTVNQDQSLAKNTAFNLVAFKMFLNSPLFSNILKSLTIMAAVSLFAIALDAIIILLRTPDQQTQLSNDNAALIITVILSILTIFYSCFTIFLESRRPPEGLDTTKSKPLFIIFSEILASIVWAQVLSVTIYIYIWTFGCTEAGEQQLDRLWKLNMADHHLTDRLCRRQGAMVGLELLLVLLLIFNFYTHLAQNFKFIRAVT